MVRHRSDDRALIRAFLAGRQTAFEELIRRHGGMVRGVCLRQLGRVHDAEDAVQAVFLILARRARRLRQRPSVAGWLHRVAVNVCRNARRAAERRARREREVAQMQNERVLENRTWDQMSGCLDGELDRLPQRLRTPLLLHCVEGLSKEDVAAQLGWREGTVSSRLHRARELLRERLARRGVALPASALAALLAQHAEAAPPALACLGAIARHSAQLASGSASLESVATSSVADIARHTLRSMRGALVTRAAALAALLTICATASAAAFGPATGDEERVAESTHRAPRPAPVERQSIARTAPPAKTAPATERTVPAEQRAAATAPQRAVRKPGPLAPLAARTPSPTPSPRATREVPEATAPKPIPALAPLELERNEPAPPAAVPPPLVAPGEQAPRKVKQAPKKVVPKKVPPPKKAAPPRVVPTPKPPPVRHAARRTPKPFPHRKGSATLFARHRAGYEAATYSFIYALRDDPGLKVTLNDWDLLFCNEQPTDPKNYFTVRMWVGDRSVIADLGAATWKGLNRRNLPKLKPVKDERSGTHDGDHVEVVPGHMYLVRSVAFGEWMDKKGVIQKGKYHDVLTLFRVESLIPHQQVKITWELVGQPWAGPYHTERPK